MNINEFFSMIIDSDCELKNIAFSENLNDYVSLLRNIKSKISIAVSSHFFNQSIHYLSEIPKMNYLQSIISLPIFNDDSNIILIVFNPDKQSDDFVLIDESDSLIHKNDENSWFFIEDNLALELSKSINNLKDSDNVLYLKANEIFKCGESSTNEIKEDDEFAEILSLKRTKKYSPKKKVIADDLVDEILDLKEKTSISPNQNRIQMDDFDVDDSLTFLNELLHLKRRQDPESLLKKYDKPLIEGNVELRRLGKISDLKNIKEKNSKNTILIATCKQCDSKLVYYNHDVEDFKGEIFVEIDNVSENVSIDYLYEYLNSSNGNDELLYFSKGNKYLRAQFIKNIKIPIPSLEVQKEIVDASREAREFFKSVDLLKKEFSSNIFDYKHVSSSIMELKGNIQLDDSNEVISMSRCLRHAYQGLIWPLAISYLSATKGSFEISEKKTNYLTLFEFIAAFNSVILLSGLPYDVYKNNFDSIWNSPKGLNDYKQMTFGNWFYLSKNLAEVYKNNNFTSKLDEELFEKITSDTVSDILEVAHHIRNEEAHPALVNIYDIEEVVEILEKYLEDIFDILDVYSNYNLIYATEDYKGSRKGYRQKVILLNGPCTQPIYEYFTFDRPLVKNSLYLYNPKNKKILEIKDNLMKFALTDDKKRWRIFIYYKCDRDEFNALYKCFQSKEKDLKNGIISFKHDILNYS